MATKITNINKETIEYYCNAGFSASKAANELNCHRQTLVKIAKQYGLFFLTPSQKLNIKTELLNKEKFQELIDNGVSKLGIAKLYNIYPSSVTKLANKFNIKCPQQPVKYPVNEEFFYTWSHDLAYILGFLMSDGNIIQRSNRNQYILQINLQSRDVDILEKIRDIISPTRPIGKPSIKKSPYSDNMSYSQNLYCSISEKLFNHLKILGLVPRKTGIEQIPERLPKEYIWSFILGYTDGDGGIHHRTDKTSKTGYCGYDWYIIGSCEKLADQLVELVPHSKKQVRNRLYKGKPAKTIYAVRVRHKDGILFLKEKLYENTSLFLDRKKKIFDGVSYA